MSIVPERFKAPYIPVEKAWAEADRIRSQFWQSGEVRRV